MNEILISSQCTMSVLHNGMTITNDERNITDTNSIEKKKQYLK